MSTDFGAMHERYLANYHWSTETYYCANPTCPYHDGIVVRYESEYGQGTITPEDCPTCNSELLQDRPEDNDDVVQSDVCECGHWTRHHTIGKHDGCGHCDCKGFSPTEPVSDEQEESEGNDA